MAHSLRSALAVATLVALIAVPTSLATAALEGLRFTSSKWGIRMLVPRSWEVTDATSYPNVLLWMSRRQPAGKMLLTAERIEPNENAFSYAKRTATLLAKLGFQVRAPQPHGVRAFTIRFNNESVFLRQALIVVGGRGYALTLSAPTRRELRRHMRSFDFALGSIKVERNGKAEK